MTSLSVREKSEHVFSTYKTYINNNDVLSAKECLLKFEFLNPNPELLYIHPILRKGKQVIATCDSNREPTDDEIIIVYGSYPDWHHAYPYSNKMYRHVSLFWKTEHDSIEYHPCWDKIDIIYIINLEKRYDRYIDILLELAKVHAPLDRIHHHKVINETGEASHINTSRQHVIVQEDFKKSNKDVCMIFEDDFTFISDVNYIWRCINEFFNRSYNFEVCFLSISKYNSKSYYDDILSNAEQSCTNATGYILSKKTIDSVLEICKEGFNLYLKHQHMGYEYCIDQYWRRLTKRFFFKKKLGFQRINFGCSDSIHISANLD